MNGVEQDMSVENPCQVLRRIHEALNKRDVEEAVSFFSEDVIQISPDGVFSGKAEIRQYFEWFLHQYPDLKPVELGLYTEGNVAIHEYVVEGTRSINPFKKVIFSLPRVDIVQIGGGKVQRIRGYYDRLILAKHLARGIIATRAIDSIIRRIKG